MTKITREGITVEIVARKGGGKGGSSGGNTSTHTATEAPNTLRSRATARILEVLSEGPVKGLVDGLKGVYLDKTPILNPDGSANFDVPEFYFRHGEPDQDVIPGFAASEAEVSVGVELKYNVPAVRRVTPGVDAVRVKVRANALYEQTKKGDVIGTSVAFKIEWNIGGAGWSDVADVTISGKTMSAYERAVRFQLPKTSQTVDVRLTRMTPDPNASVVNGIYWSSYTEIVDGTLTYADTSIAAMVIDAQYFPNVPTRGFLLDGIVCQIPSNYYPTDPQYANYAVWSADFTKTSSWSRGGSGQATRTRTPDGQSVSGYTTTFDFTVAANMNLAQSPIAREGNNTWSAEWFFKAGAAVAGPLNYRLDVYDDLSDGRFVRYDGGPGTVATGAIGDPTWREDFAEVVDLGNGYMRARLTMSLVDPLTSPPTTVRIRVQFQNVLTIGDVATCQGATLTPGASFGKFITTEATVPVYGPRGWGPRHYEGDWDGTFKSEWTNNPAWILYELLNNPRYGVGRDIDAAAVDKWGLYECSQYNDGLVPDGNGTGGTEPRFTCNAVINTREDAYKVLNAVAASMRALLYVSNGTIFVVQDRPIIEWSRLFSPANITDGLFDYTGADYRSRFNAVAVSWNDPSQNYDPVVELVTDPELISTQPYRDTDAVAYGCTVRGQAIRHGRWVIYTNQEEDELVSFKTSVENADVRPGQGILIQDPSRVGARLAGRTLEQLAPGELLLDAPATGIQVGWKVYLAFEKTILETTVVQVITETRLAVSGLPGGTYPPASMWLAHDVTIEPTTWRVVAIKEGGKNTYEILAARYSPGKYSYVDDGVRIPPPIYSTIPTGPLVGPTDIAIKEYIYLDPSGLPQFGVVLSWVPSTDSRVAAYAVELEGPSSDLRQMRNIVGTSVDVPLMRQGNWTAYVTASDNLGRRSTPLVYTFNPVGLSAKPQPPYAIFATVNGTWLDLEWLPTDEIDVLYYWIQYSPKTDGTASWNTSTSITTRAGRNTTRVTVPARVGTYLIKSVDALGQESAEAKSVIVYRDVRPPNNIVNLIEEPAWAGTKNLWTKNGDYLELAPPAAPEDVPPEIYPGQRGVTIDGTPTRYSYYYFANSMDQGAVGNTVISVWPEAFGSYGDNSMSTWTPLARAQPLAMGSSNAWDIAMEMRGTQDGVNWGPWRPTTATTVDVRAVEIRMVGMIYDLQTTIRVARSKAQIDVPDRALAGSSVPFDAQGRATVVYSLPFYATPNLQFTGFAAGNQGTNIVIISSDRDGFTCEQRRDNGQPVGGGSFNWLATGYGVS